MREIWCDEGDGDLGDLKDCFSLDKLGIAMIEDGYLIDCFVADSSQ